MSSNGALLTMTLKDIRPINIRWLLENPAEKLNMIFNTLPGARKHLMNNFIKEAISQSEQHDWRKETPAGPLQTRRMRRRLKFKDSIKPIEGFSMAEFQTEIKRIIRPVTTIGKDHKINPGSLEVSNIFLICQSWRGYEWNKKHYAIITKNK